MPESLFNKVVGLSCDFRELSKNTFFTEHLWTTASTTGDQSFRKTKNFHSSKISKINKFNKYKKEILLSFCQICVRPFSQ